jgi:2'-5' RNA ligase
VTRRLFVAAWLPEAAAREAARVLDRLRSAGGDVKWVSPENLHVTLRFLGDTDEGRVAALVDAVTDAAEGVSPFALALGTAGTFPPRGTPRVVWLGIDRGAREIADLARRVEERLVARGLVEEPETRPFRAHVTLGRPRSPRNLERLTDLLAEVSPEGRAHRLEEVRLVESRLPLGGTPGGAKYAAVARVPLTGGRTSGKMTIEGGEAS